MTATTSIQQLAATAGEWLETAERVDGDEDSRYVRVKDGAPEWVRDLVYTAHGDAFLPDDWRYKWTRDALEYIAEVDDPDDSVEFADQAVSIYTSDRLAWLSSNLNRAGYCDAAAADFGAEATTPDIIGMIGWGQYAEATDVYGLVLRALEDVSAEVES